MGALSANLSRCSSIWPCCLSQPPYSVRRSQQLRLTLIQRLKLILTISMVDMGLDIMDMVDMLDMDIMEGRGGLLKQSLLLKQIQMLKLILTISMVDMGLDIMDMVVMPDMDTLGMDIMGMENKPVQ